MVSIPRRAVVHRAVSPLLPYTVAALAIVVATAVRQAFDPWMAREQVFSWYYLAVVVCAWHGGWRSAFVASVCGYVLAYWFFIEPRHTFDYFLSGRHWSGMATFACVCAAVATCAEALQRQVPALVLRFDLDNSLELLDVASAIRQHNIGPSELPAYLEGLNASPVVCRLAMHFSRSDATPRELANRLEAFVKGSGQVARLGV